ncbi:MAG: WD40 repeat domain-containing protein, partial [Actinomycetota bacterium]
GDLFAESGQGPTVFVRDRASGEVVPRLETGSPGVVGMAVAPDGSLLATAGYDGQVILWDCGTWKPLRRLPAGRRANAVTFSRSGRLLAAAVEKQVLVWDHTQDEPVDGTDLPIKGVYDLAMSPDGRRLAQTGADGKVRIWTLR